MNELYTKQDASRVMGLFVTGTDTGVGKTLVTGGIARLLTGQGLKIGVFKPFATGCRSENNELISSDAEFLRMCAEAHYPLSVISPTCYQTPAAPLVSSRQENRPIDYHQVEENYRYLCRNCDIVLVEGIGGVLVPLDEHRTVLDWAVPLGLPAIIVARPDLGTINHTLMTLKTIRDAGLFVAGVVISGYNSKTNHTAEKTVGQIISQYGRTRILAVVEYDEKSDVEKLSLGDLVLDGLSQCDWNNLINECYS